MYLVFRLDPYRWFAVDGIKIEKILPNEDVFALPRIKPEAVGVVRYKSILVPVYDFRVLLPDLFPVFPPLNHLVVFYGNETLNAFVADAAEMITEDCVMTDASLKRNFLEPLDLIYNESTYSQLDFASIEEHLNIP